MTPARGTRAGDGDAPAAPAREPPRPAAAPARSAATPVSPERGGPRAPGGVGPETAEGAAGAVAMRAQASEGAPLSPGARSYFQPLLGGDLAAVRVHRGAAAAAAARGEGARALAAGNDVVLGDGAPPESTRAGRALLGHELAHVLQQRRGGGSDAGAAEGEGEAHRAGAFAALGLPFRVAHGAPAGVAQASTASDDVKAAWAATGDKARVFDRLRALSPAPGDADLTALLPVIFPNTPDDLWLAQTIQAHGPEPLWPRAALDERGTRAAAGAWPPEPGNIEASLGKTAGKRDVKAYYFRGLTDQRALIIAGVHGTEQSGVEVVEMLRTALATGPRPHYTVILVPQVFPDNVAAGIREGSTETNRNFPKPGESLATAKAAGGAKGAVDAKGKAILPENLILMDLIERFRPSRLASVHATWDPKKAGIFSDQHTVSAGAKAKAGAAGVPALEAAADARTKADEAMALQMAGAAEKKGAKVAGNKLATAPTSGWGGGTPGGTSMGGWGPSDVTEGKASDRAGMTVITVEVSGNENSSKLKGADLAARTKEFEALRDVLRDIFLGPP